MVRRLFSFCSLAISSYAAICQPARVQLIPSATGKSIDVNIGGKLFTRFLYPDSLEKPVLYPINTAAGTPITRGFPLEPRAGEPTDHPHHIGLWLNYENVNGIDFWNNSYAIPAEKKQTYGWIKTDSVWMPSVQEIKYHARWTDWKGRALLEENTRLIFHGQGSARVIDRITELTADTAIVFTDAKDGLLGLRLARELQLPATTDQVYTDSRGIQTTVKANHDPTSTGDYLTSEGKRGDSAWSTRGKWCRLTGRIGKDTVSVAILDHPDNPGYPTYWHARGYGLFAANPLGEKIFSNGKTTLNYQLASGNTVRFRFLIIVKDGTQGLTPDILDQLQKEFSRFAY